MSYFFQKGKKYDIVLFVYLRAIPPRLSIKLQWLEWQQYLILYSKTHVTIGLSTRDVEAAILLTASAPTPIASASTNKQREKDRWP